jgi:hypothetical protein
VCQIRHFTPARLCTFLQLFAARRDTAIVHAKLGSSQLEASLGYFVISPAAGAVRGSIVQVNPSETTSYTLAATNQFGHSTATVTVTVAVISGVTGGSRQRKADLAVRSPREILRLAAQERIAAR